ncbi:hypothetical protein BP5796_01152 [Coleophoma crateriformis]|uniref:Uncharacterized protein n=1 Tax=Coleophoma crateriformis TaxID=565419 RepID=A0A3D8T179_9HELO|nr:hypothetical protein BP5796_01152 [Coleophoma crateriformis]
MANAAELAYNDLISLIPRLSYEVATIRTSLHEHNDWLARNTDANSASSTTLDSSGSTPSIAQVKRRRDQTAAQLQEGEELLREYRERLSDLSNQMGIAGYENEEPDSLERDIVGEEGTWRRAEYEDGLPGYEKIEYREELMVGVGEQAPPYAERNGVPARDEAPRQWTIGDVEAGEDAPPYGEPTPNAR